MVVVIDRVFLVVEPRYEWDTTARTKREQAIKQTRLTLATADIFSDSASRGGQEEQKNPGYLQMLQKTFREKLINKFAELVDNLQLHIREVHIRYEDRVTCPTDFCIGFSLESLHVQSREPEYDPSPPAGRLFLRGPNTFHKHIQINHFTVYWNPLSSKATDATVGVFSGRSNLEVEALMSRTIAKRNQSLMERPKHHYYLEPVDISITFDVSFDPDTLESYLCVAVDVTDIYINFEDRQFRELLVLSANVSNFVLLEQYSMFRPTVSVRQN
jgi:hypothetical protein